MKKESRYRIEMNELEDDCDPSDDFNPATAKGRDMSPNRVHNVQSRKIQRDLIIKKRTTLLPITERKYLLCQSITIIHLARTIRILFQHSNLVLIQPHLQTTLSKITYFLIRPILLPIVIVRQLHFCAITTLGSEIKNLYPPILRSNYKESTKNIITSIGRVPMVSLNTAMKWNQNISVSSIF